MITPILISKATPILVFCGNFPRCQSLLGTGKLAYFSFLLILGAHGSSALAQTTWTNLTGGSWSVNGNWRPNLAPGATTNAFLTNSLSTSYAVTFDSGAAFNNLTVQNVGTGTNTLQLGAAGFSPAGNVTIGPRGVFDNNGYSAVFGGGITVSNLGQFFVQGNSVTVATNSGSAFLGGNVTITNNGVFQVGASGQGIVTNASRLRIGNGGTLNAGIITTTNSTMVGITTVGAGGGAAVINGTIDNLNTLGAGNLGQCGINVSGGANGSSFSIVGANPFLNNVNAGTIALASNATFNVGGTTAATATASFTNRGSIYFLSGANIDTATEQLNAGTLVNDVGATIAFVNGGTTLTNFLNADVVNKGQFTFNSSGAADRYVRSLTNSGSIDFGQLSGARVLVGNGDFYNSGSVTMFIQNITVTNGAVVNGVSGSMSFSRGSLKTSFLEQDGYLRLTNSGVVTQLLYTDGSALSFTNKGTVSWSATAPGSVNDTVSMGTMYNRGTFTIDGAAVSGSGLVDEGISHQTGTILNMANGTLNVQSNALASLGMTFTNLGTVTVDNGAVLMFGYTGRNYTNVVAGSSVWRNDGLLILTNGGCLAVKALTNSAAATLSGNGTVGTLGLTNVGSTAYMNVQVAAIVNSGTIAPGGVLNAGVITNASGGMIRGYGVIQSINTTNLNVTYDAGAQIVNQAGASVLGSGGTLVLSNGFKDFYQAGTVGATNNGTLQLGDGTLGFTNGGTISVNGGRVNFGAVVNTNTVSFINGAGVYSGLFTVTNSGSYVSQASSNYFNAGLLVANTGTFTVTNGNSVITGVVTNAGTFNVYNGGGTVSNAVVNRNGVVNLNMGAGNAWTLLGGTTVGDAAGATGAVTLASGTLAVTNGSASAVMDVVRGNLGMTNGTVLADSMYATNGAASVISFNGGTLSVGSLVVSNGSAFVAGNGTLAATNLFLSGYAANGSRFANGLVINTNAVAALGASERLDDATVVKLQGGTLDLGGFSETVGTVLVDGGVVQSSGGGTLSAGAITNLTGGATFLVSGGSLMLAAPVGGGGLLAKTGGGTLVLSGANTYSGATVIGAGTLQVGSGGTSGTLGTGNVTNNAALVFNRSDSVTVGNLIVGTGSLTQSGAGTVVLTGANTYSGGTTVGAGTLGLGADNVLGGGLVTMSGGGLATSGGARALINAVNLASGASFDTAAGNLTMSGAITNGGSLVKSGANTLILGGANSYSGATVIGAGTVQVGSGGTSGTLGTGNVTNNAALVFNRSDSVTAGNLIAGTGSLTQGGTGTLILSGANTYSGGTVVQAGTLQIAGDGNLGAAAGSLTLTNGANLQITGDVSMGRALSVNAGGVRLTLGANTLSNSGSLSGTGALTLSGAGLLALTGDGSGYSGAVTNLNGATLRLDSANALGSAGLVLGASTVVTNTATTTISGTLSGGTGIVLGKSGAGRLMLSGNSGASFLGDTRVSGGTLAVNGSLGGSAVTVGSGARLEGTGTVGALVNHGTVQPGDASTIGTLTVSGAYTNAADGTLAMKLGNGGLCDRLLVGGAAVLDGSLSLTTLGGYVPHAGDTFTNLVTAAGGVSGKFAATSLTPTLEFTVSYNANDVGVRMGAAVTRNYVGPGLGLNGSQMELGQALQGAAGTASGDLNTVLSAIDQLGTADSVRQAYNEILPAKFVGLTAVGMNGSMLQVNNLQNHFMNMNSGPMAAASVGESAWGRKPIALAYNGDLGDLGLGWPEGREPLRREWQFFIQGMGTIADQETTATSPGFSYTAEGMTLGADYRLTPELAVGVSTGYSHTGSNLAGSGGTVDVETIPLWIYESWQTGGWHLDAGGGFSLNLYENERNIRFPGIERTAKSDPLGTQADGFLGGGYDFRVGRWTVGPMGSVRYTKLWIEDFTESGADALNLAVAGQEAQSLQSGLGVRAAYEWDVGGVKLTPNAQASYQHEYCNDSRGIEARLAQGSSAFQVKTDSPERNFVEIGAGMNVILNDQVSIFLHYDTEAGRETFSTHSVNGGLQVSF